MGRTPKRHRQKPEGRRRHSLEGRRHGTRQPPVLPRFRRRRLRRHVRRAEGPALAPARRAALFRSPARRQTRWRERRTIQQPPVGPGCPPRYPSDALCLASAQACAGSGGASGRGGRGSAWSCCEVIFAPQGALWAEGGGSLDPAASAPTFLREGVPMLCCPRSPDPGLAGEGL